MLALLGEKLIVFIGGQTCFLCWGQTGSRYWGTNRLPLLRDKQIALVGGQTGCLYWGTNRLSNDRCLTWASLETPGSVPNRQLYQIIIGKSCNMS